VPTTVDTAIEGVRIQSKPVQTREIFDIGGSDIGGSRACGTNKPRMLPFSDLALCRGFVQTEGWACARFDRPPLGKHSSWEGSRPGPIGFARTGIGACDDGSRQGRPNPPTRGQNGAYILHRGSPSGMIGNNKKARLCRALYHGCRIPRPRLLTFVPKPR